MHVRSLGKIIFFSLSIDQNRVPFDTGRYKTQVTGHRVQVTGHRSQGTGHKKRSKNSQDTPLGFFVLFPVTPQSGICLPSTMLSGFVLRVEQVNG